MLKNTILLLLLCATGRILSMQKVTKITPDQRTDKTSEPISISSIIQSPADIDSDSQTSEEYIEVPTTPKPLKEATARSRSNSRTEKEATGESINAGAHASIETEVRFCRDCCHVKTSCKCGAKAKYSAAGASGAVIAAAATSLGLCTIQ